MLRRLALTLMLLWSAAAFAEQVSISSLTRYSGNPIVPFSAWPLTNNNGGQVAEPCIIVNPADSSKLIMYFSAFDTQQTGQVARMDGLAANPQSGWNLAGAVFTTVPRGAGGSWDAQYVRIGSCFYQGSWPSGTFYIYYTGGDASNNNKAGLATSTDGVTFAKYGGNPIMSPTGGKGDETQVEDIFVWPEGGTYTMLYSYRTASLTLPGIRYATSSDGLAWTKNAVGDVVTCAAGSYCESHRVRKYGNTYLLLTENGSNSTSWTNIMYEGPSIIGPYTAYSGNPIMTKTGSGPVPCCVGALPWPGWEQFHVATPDLFFNADGKVYLFYQGSGQLDQPYGNNQWSIGVAQVVLSSLAVAGGGHGRWFR
jgi:hypothetical protein